MNLEQALEIIEDEYTKARGDDTLYPGSFVYYFSSPADEDTIEQVEIVTVVDTLGGYEGAGEDCHVVVKVDHPEHGVVYVKWEGYYNTWEGSEYDNEPFLVVPTEKTITVYEKQKETV